MTEYSIETSVLMFTATQPLQGEGLRSENELAIPLTSLLTISYSSGFWEPGLLLFRLETSAGVMVQALDVAVVVV